MSTIREQILSANDLSSEMFTSPEWGVTVKVKSISEAVRRQLVKDCDDGKGDLDLQKFAPRIIIATFVDPLNDAPIFEPADADAISGKSMKAIEKAIKVCMRVCGFSGAVTEKNSEETKGS